MSTQRRPNILFMMADDHRHDAIGAAGDPVVKTPTMDRLIAEGTHMRQAHIMGGLSGAVCVPSRACMHTGRHVFASSASNSYNDYGGFCKLPAANICMAETFRNAGYHTFGTGKWHNCKESFARSFSDGGKIFFGGMSDHLNCPVFDFDPSGEYPQGNGRRGEEFSTDLFANAAIGFLERYEGDAPFFLYCAFTSPHDPRMAPEEVQRDYPPAGMPLPMNFMEEHPFDNGEMRIRDEALAPFPRTSAEIRRHVAEYYAMIDHQDRHMGRILAALEARGELENTIIVYTGDHGLAVGQHGLLGKQNMYDHSIRIPMLLRGPGVPAGAKRDALVYGYDLYPTLCDLADVPVPASVMGRSAVGVVRGETDEHRQTTYAVYCDIQASVTDREWKLIRYYPKRYGAGGSDRVQLFHLASDPWELKDLAAAPAHAERREAMLRELHRWQVEVGDPLAAR